LKPWKVQYSKVAKRELSKLSKVDQQQVMRSIDRYAENESGDVKKLQVDVTSTWRLRAGDWRVFFDKDNASSTLTIARIRNRKDSY